MAGDELDRPLAAYFPPGTPRPRQDALLIEGLIAAAEAELDREGPNPAGHAHWIAGRPRLRPSGESGPLLSWAYRGGIEELLLGSPSMPKAMPEAIRLRSALDRLMGEAGGMRLDTFLGEAGIAPGDDVFERLRGSGLVVV
jgi:hypothetical protein